MSAPNLGFVKHVGHMAPRGLGTHLSSIINGLSCNLTETIPTEQAPSWLCFCALWRINSMRVANPRLSPTTPTTMGMDAGRALCSFGRAHTWVHASADGAIRPVPITAGARLTQMRAQARGDAVTASMPSSSPETPRTAIPQQSRACVATSRIGAQSCCHHCIQRCEVCRICCTCPLPPEHGTCRSWGGNLQFFDLSTGRICCTCRPILSLES